MCAPATGHDVTTGTEAWSNTTLPITDPWTASFPVQTYRGFAELKEHGCRPLRTQIAESAVSYSLHFLVTKVAVQSKL